MSALRKELKKTEIEAFFLRWQVASFHRIGNGVGLRFLQLSREEMVAGQ